MNGNIGYPRNYIIITLCKNEGGNLPALINSITNQTIKPILWVIVDDGSTDNTPNILNKAQNRYNWIRILRLDDNCPRDLGLHLAKLLKKGFDFAIEFCRKEGLDYNYLGNVDGDLTLPPTFFENIIVEFEKDSKIGVGSGGIILTINDRFVQVKGLPEDEPSGGDMLIRRKCFEDIGGIPQSYSFDTVIKAKARLRGWKTKRFEDNLATEARDVGNAEGYMKGFIHMGKASYYLNIHPIHVFGRGLIKSFKKPYYGGIIYVASYLNSFFKRDRQIEDEEIKDYFWNKWKQVYSDRLSSKVNHEVIE